VVVSIREQKRSMNARKTLITYWSVIVLYGAVVGHFISQDLEPPRLLDFLFIVAVSVLVYLWYYFDATERRFTRSATLGGAVVLFTFLAVPYYLARSRPQGQRLRAVLKFAAAVVFSFVVLLLSALPFVWLGSGA
jgi:hypothetical protein